jgi:hypothetical protein
MTIETVAYATISGGEPAKPALHRAVKPLI